MTQETSISLINGLRLIGWILLGSSRHSTSAATTLQATLVVERFFAWLQWFRRPVTRYEYHIENFLGMVRLGCIKSC